MGLVEHWALLGCPGGCGTLPQQKQGQQQQRRLPGPASAVSGSFVQHLPPAQRRIVSARFRAAGCAQAQAAGHQRNSGQGRSRHAARAQSPGGGPALPEGGPQLGSAWPVQALPVMAPRWAVTCTRALHREQWTHAVQYTIWAGVHARCPTGAARCRRSGCSGRPWPPGTPPTRSAWRSCRCSSCT